jgi:TonB family protein
MNSIIQYIIEANLCLIVMGLVYLLLLRKEQDFNFRRYYVLFTAIIVLIVPLISIPFFGGNNVNLVNELQTIILPELTIGEVSDTAIVTINYSSITVVFVILYVVITALFSQAFLFQLFQIGWFYRSFKKKSTRVKGYKLIETNGSLPTFSFFRIIFFDNTIDLSIAERNKIIDHEIIHIQQFHSLDVILMEVMKAICWFNPLAWFLRNEIQDLHEFLADREVVKNTDEAMYNSLLAKMTLTKAHLSLGHHFNKSKTLKRIAMMKVKNKSIQQWKHALIIPIVLLTVIVISCNDEVIQDVNAVMKTASQIEMPAELKDDLADLERRYPNAEFVYLEAAGTAEDALKNLKDIDPLSIAFIKSFKDENKVGFIINKNGPIKNKPDIDNVYTVVDEAAKPEGGYEKYYQWLSTELKYPKQARSLGIEGKVYVQFIVNQIGEITEVEVVKGIGGGCDKAAIDAVSASNNWSAPKQDDVSVSQRIILPITFALGNSKTESTQK